MATLSKRLPYWFLIGIVWSGAIAPLSITQTAQANTREKIKACKNEQVLLPQHRDVQALNRLFQHYLKRSLPQLALGLNREQMAQAILTFDIEVKRSIKSAQATTLSNADTILLEQLKSNYAKEITALKVEPQDSSHERYPLAGSFGGFTGLGNHKVGGSVRQQTTLDSRTLPSAIPPAPAIVRPPTSPSIVPPPRPRPELENFNTEEYARVSENPFFIPSQTPRSTFSIDVDTASYSNMRRFINQGQLPPKDAVRIEEMINYFSYDYDTPQNDEPFAIHTEVAKAPWNTDHQLVQIGLKGKELDTPKPSNLVFLVDVSGSMRSPNKLQLLQRSLCMMVREMKPEDHITLVTYAGSAGLVLPPTSGRNRSKILTAIDNLQAGGSTAGSAGINLAYEMAQKHFRPEGNNRVILATDGDFNVGVSSNAELERIIEKKRRTGVFLTVLGFGTGNYKDSKMEILANKGNGNYAYIDTLAEARKVLVEDITSTLFTIAKDVKIQVEFNPQHVQAYRLIGYENRILRDQDFNNDKIDAGEIGAGHTVTALYEIIPTGITTNIELPTVEQLKYQAPNNLTSGSLSNELMEVKLRYKQPQGNQSRLVSRIIENQTQATMSQNLETASTVAMFGMMLRDSEYKGATTLETLLHQSQKLDTRDPYQSELLALMQKFRSIRPSM